MGDRYDDRRRDYDRRGDRYDDRGGGRDYDRRGDRHDDRGGGRDYDRRGGDRYDDRDKDRDRGDRDRDRERERDRPERPKRRGWDDMGDNPQNAQLLLQQQQAFAQQQTPMAPTMPGSKKQRELYVGNLPPEANESELINLFGGLLSACEGFNPVMGPPVPNAAIAGGGTFAFVEFRDEQLCETAMLFTGIQLHGRALKIGHPNGYVVPMMAVARLKPPDELMAKLGLMGGGGGPVGGAAAGTAAGGSDKRQRELYIGNLTVNAVDAAMLRELFTKPLWTLPGVDPAVPPVREARVDSSGKFAFIEFDTEAIAATALEIFNGFEFAGRAMKIARPSGYVAPLTPLVPLTAVGAAAAAPPPPGPLQPLQPLGPLGGGGGGMGLQPLGGGGMGMGMGMGMGGAPPGMGGMPGMPMPPAPPAEPPKPVPTHTLCLKNLLSAEIMADPTEFAECVDDIKGECESFGAIAAFVVPTADDLKGRDASDVGCCFVKYDDIISAAKAQDALHGRDFDGNSVEAIFLPAGSL